MIEVDSATRDKWETAFNSEFPPPLCPAHEDTGDASYACLLARQAANPGYSYKESINLANWRQRAREYAEWKKGLWERVKMAYNKNPFQTMRCIDSGDLNPWRHM